MPYIKLDSLEIIKTTYSNENCICVEFRTTDFTRSEMKIEKDLRHPKGEKINDATPKGLEDIFGSVGVINTTVLVPVERSYTMRPYIPHSAQKKTR